MKTKFYSIVLILISLFILPFGSLAGDLDPPASPASTMKTLTEVEPRTLISSLPYTISTSGSYYIAGNLTSTGSGIIVDVDDVTIDLNGFAINGPGTGTGYGISISNQKNVEIKNGTVRDFGSYGIRCNYSTDEGHRVINVRVIENAGNGISFTGKGHFIKACTVINNGTGIGIKASYGATIINNTVYNNGSDGIQTWTSSLIMGNTVYANDGDGIKSSYSATVVNNIANGNGGDGFDIGSYATIRGNTANNNNDYGIDASSYTLLKDNTARNNTGGNYNSAACTNCVIVDNRF